MKFGLHNKLSKGKVNLVKYYESCKDFPKALLIVLHLTDMLISAGVSREVVEKDAYKMEHGISDENFGKLKKVFKQ